MYKLIIEDDEGKTTVVPIIRDEITVGRKEGNTIRLTERNVSRRHARIIRQNSALYIEDLLSYNGIKVNGDRISGKVSIGDGDRIQIGDYQLSIKLDKADAKPGAGAGDATSQMPRQADPAVAPTVQQPAVGPNQSLPTVQHPVVAPSKAPEKPARLIVISTNFARQEFPLDKDAVVIGRTDDNDVVLNHRSISRHHAKILREKDHFHIVDNQSANGVRVNGEEYGKVELRKGDQIDLGHVRLIFVPPGQDIDIRDKIVDLDSGRSPTMAIVLALLVLVIVGGGAYWWFMLRAPSGNPDAEANQILVDVEADLSAKRWSEAAEKSSRVLQNPGVSIKAKEVAQVKKTKAETEAKAKLVYDRFAMAAGGSNYDQALSAYKEIPDDSVYRNIAREDYDKIFPLFAESHLKSAEEARAQGNCTEFQNQVQIVLNMDPKQVKALAAKDRPCGGAVANDTPREPREPREPNNREPRKPRKPNEQRPPDLPEPVAPTPTPAAPAPAEPSADVDARLTEAQSEYVNGNLQRAIDLAKSVQKGSPVRAWRIIGSAACKLKETKLVNEAFKRLDTAGRQFLIYVCQREGITASGGSQFRLAEP